MAKINSLLIKFKKSLTLTTWLSKESKYMGIIHCVTGPMQFAHRFGWP